MASYSLFQKPTHVGSVQTAAIVGSDGSAATMRGACARMVIALLLANTLEAVRAWLCANAGTLNVQSMRQVGDCMIVHSSW